MERSGWGEIDNFQEFLKKKNIKMQEDIQKVRSESQYKDLFTNDLMERSGWGVVDNFQEIIKEIQKKQEDIQNKILPNFSQGFIH